MEDRGRNEESGARVAVDAHVHFHPCFDVDSFLSGALENIRLEARLHGRAPEEALLLVAEMRKGPGFSELTDAVARSSQAGREVLAGGRALCIDTGAPPRLVLIPGRQIQTREKLEILTVGAFADPPDGEIFSESLARVVASESAAILPWAFGKWTGSRGRLILEAMEQHPAGSSIWEIPEPDARGCRSRARFVAHRIGALRTFAAGTHFPFQANFAAGVRTPTGVFAIARDILQMTIAIRRSCERKSGRTAFCRA